jgi:hypothetical protein
MSRNAELEEQIQQLIFSINPYTATPYPADLMQVADGQGTRRWQDVFQTISSQSVTDGAPLGYLPSTIFAISNDTSTFSSIVATSYSTLSTQIGEGGIPGSITTYQLQSTTQWILYDATYVSTAALVSSMTPFLNGSLSFMSNIQSTVIGLGSTRYVSTPTLFSTTVGLNNQGASTVRGLGSAGYISSLSLQSTINGFGTAGYVSSATLYSTITGMLYPETEPGGSLGLVVTGTNDPPFRNFSTLTSNYLSTNQYFNSLNATTFGIVFGTQLPSTYTGIVSSLGSIGYVSTQALLSTSAGIQAAKQNIFIDNTGNVSIFNSDVYLSSVNAITFLSSFVNSSIIYKGENGLIGGRVTGNSNMAFSTANLQLDLFSSLITSSTRLVAEFYPTFYFDAITAGALTSKAQTMQTFIQYSTHVLSSIHETVIPCISAQNNYSNFFQQPMKIHIDGLDVLNRYAEPYRLTHSLPGAISYSLNVGFRSSNIGTFFASTNSYFLTLQNLTF